MTAALQITRSSRNLAYANHIFGLKNQGGFLQSTLSGPGFTSCDSLPRFGGDETELWCRSKTGNGGSGSICHTAHSCNHGSASLLSMSFVSKHIRGETTLKSETLKTSRGKKRNKCSVELQEGSLLLPCCFMVLKNYPGAVAAEKWRVSGSCPGVDKIWEVFWR